MEIKHIALHHAGPTQDNLYASTRHHTWKDINNWHKRHWGEASKHIPHSYGGYNACYSPVTRKFHQFRAIGEQTIAQAGYNHDTYSLCIIGNYTFDPTTGTTVDPVTPEMEQDIADHLLNLIAGNKDNWLVAPGTKLNMSVTRARPHRWFQANRDCYGTGLSDHWITEILSSEKSKKITLLKQLIKLYIQLIQQKKAEQRLRGKEEHSCPGIIN